MRRTRFISILLLALMGAVPVCHAVAEESGKPVLENYDRYIGRDAVTNNRAANLKMYRPLPLACPPFHLRDKDGKIIDPTKIEPLLDEEGKPLPPEFWEGIPRAVSTKQTCGACHDYNTITRGYHFRMGHEELDEEAPGGEGVSPNRGPGVFGKWQLLYQRELAPKHFDDPDDVDMTPWEWVLTCGICHPGGGPAEYDRGFRRYDEMLAWDRGITLFGDSDYYDSGWDKTGVIEADCFICHLENYEYSLRVQQIKKLNYEFAATAAAGFGYVWGAVREGQQPKVYYKKDLFRADGAVHLHIRRPSDRQCMACHDISSAQKRGSSWHSHYMQDVHTAQGLLCRDCHPGDIRHNFAKGGSSSQTVRDDLDHTSLSCKECHERKEFGAPDYEHAGLPPIHLERISCEACHITHRPFAATAVVDTLTGEATQLPVQTDPEAYDSYAFGAMWGKVLIYSKDNVLTPFTAGELERAASLSIEPGASLREYFKLGDNSRLPEGAFTVRGFIEDAGGLALEDAHALMLLALEEGFEKDEALQAVCVFRGKAYKFAEGALKPMTSKLQPRRAGATIAESPFTYGRSKGDGLIYPESCQLGVFWAYVDQGVARPLFLRDMEAAWDYLNSGEFKFHWYPAQPANGAPSPALPEAPPPPEGDEAAIAAAEEAAKNGLRMGIAKKLEPYSPDEARLLEVFDDNNDAQPEANTEDEIALVGWALKQAVPRLADRELYYIKGTSVYKLHAAEWMDPYAVDYLEMPRIGENEAFLAVQRFEEKEVPGAHSWDPFTKQWHPAELRLARPLDVTVEKIEKPGPAIGQLAQRLPWTVAHGVEPAEQALGAGGCADCHSADAHFFFGEVATDPFQDDGTPRTVPMHTLLGYSRSDILIGAWREEVLKPWSPWIVLVVLCIILLHFALVGSKTGTPVGTPNVLRFRFHERIGHLIAMVSVVILAVTGFCFLLGKNDPLGPWARTWHTYAGYASIVGVIVIFLAWFAFMFPAKGDLRWLLKAGGYLGGVKEHLPAGKFNAGQKILFWIAIAACGVLIVTGLMMALKLGVHFSHQELVYTIHDIAGLLMILVLMAHVYLATIVVPHSLRSIFGGKVSDIWAREHHANWKFKSVDSGGDSGQATR